MLDTGHWTRCVQLQGMLDAAEDAGQDAGAGGNAEYQTGLRGLHRNQESAQDTSRTLEPGSWMLDIQYNGGRCKNPGHGAS